MRSPTTDQKLIDMEIERLRSTLNNDVQKKSNQSSFKWSDFLVRPGRKALIIGIVLAALNHITGSYALLNYTATIFEASGSIISPNESALVVGIIQLIGTFIVPILIDRSGRKVSESIMLDAFDANIKNLIYFLVLYFYVGFICHIDAWCGIGLCCACNIYDVKRLELSSGNIQLDSGHQFFLYCVLTIAWCINIELHGDR